MSSTTERKLAAIMFTDIAGYTAQMSKDEARAMELLKEKESILKPLLEEYKGTFVKSIGDGTLTYFESAVNAASCAVRLQELTYDQEDLNIRAGIHIGDIVFKDDDVFGDGVNISARLESMAPVGGVCVSKNVYDELMNQKGFEGVDLGLQSLKGVGRLVAVYGLKGSKLKEPDPHDYKENKVDVHEDDEVPSIAVIPFDNKGADEDVFYAYGVSADLISDISNAGMIRVSSLSDIEKIDNYKKLNANQLSSQLNVRYLVQGSLWKINDLFQLNVEVVDTKKDTIIWSDRWQEKWEDLTNIKNQLYSELTKILNRYSENRTLARSINVDAYKIYLESVYLFKNANTRDDVYQSIELSKKALSKDSNLLKALRHIIWSYMRYEHRKSKDYNKKLKLYLDNNPGVEDYQGYLWDFYILNGWVKQSETNEYNAFHRDKKKKFDESRHEYQQALKIAKKNNWFDRERDCLHNIARTYLADGRWFNDNESYLMHDEYAFKSMEITKKLSDVDPIQTHSNLAMSYLFQKKYELAEKYIELEKRGVEKINSQVGRCHAYAHSIKLYLEHYNDIPKAMKLLAKFEKIAINLDYLGFLAGTYKQIANYFQSINDNKMANHYQELSDKFSYDRDKRNKELDNK